ncbi:MAG TPA: DinB family protein [Candidatus Dormibacteraeota bacterium]|nr:DinB family protein [Candidatus Dormibacteraeota bacterium]
MDPVIERAVSRMAEAGRSFAELRPAVVAKEPWPLAERFDHAPEASWGPPEILAHVEEMLPFWSGEMERILAARLEPVPFGRVATDPVRLGIIGRDRAVPLRELFDRIDADVARWQRRLPVLGAGDLARRGLHPRRGEMSVADVLEAFVVGHLEEHAMQLRDVLASGR